MARLLPRRNRDFLLGGLIALQACAGPFTETPLHPLGPRISQLVLSPHRLTAGCPATLTFRFKDPDGDIVLARAHWSREQSNSVVEQRYLTLPVDRGWLAGKSGQGRVELRPEAPGAYWYAVQVEDARGHRSNVLRATLLVDAPLPSGTTPTECR